MFEPPSEACSLLSAYVQYLRQPFFTGFLTASGFLFSVTSFVLTNLLKDIYSNKDYQAHVRKLKLLDPGIKLTAQLTWAKVRLFSCIAATLFASITQVTVGFLPNDGAAIFCIASAGVGFMAMIYALYTCITLMVGWFRWLEDNYGPNAKDV